MTEPLRPTPQPEVHPGGLLKTRICLSPAAFQVRARVEVHPDKVTPIIFVPGIMGSNLKTVPANPTEKLELAWRRPNGKIESLGETRSG